MEMTLAFGAGGSKQKVDSTGRMRGYGRSESALFLSRIVSKDRKTKFLWNLANSSADARRSADSSFEGYSMEWNGVWF